MSDTPRMYVSMDGVLVHIREQGWKELKLGAIYTTTTCRSRTRPEHVDVRTVAPSFVTALTEAATFGPRLWAEAAARGVPDATEVIVLGDGSHWIWNLAATYFQEASQVLDWYHASSYVWSAAHTIYGEGTALAKHWAKEQLSKLWEGKVVEVLETLQAHASAGEGVVATRTYFTEHQERMRYDAYRARGLQLGSGTIESGCKHVIGARLKQAGMRWSVAGAVAVGTVRAWLKSGRWEEAMRVRRCRRRTYGRKVAATEVEAAPSPQPVADVRGSKADVPPQGTAGSVRSAGRQRGQQAHRGATATGGEDERTLLAAAPHKRAAPRRPAADHPWNSAWSRRRQKQEQAEQERARTQASAA